VVEAEQVGMFVFANLPLYLDVGLGRHVIHGLWFVFCGLRFVVSQWRLWRRGTTLLVIRRARVAHTHVCSQRRE
jgi:hypothetical protein